MKMRRLIGGALIVLLGSELAWGQELPRLQDKPISELVRMLGSERFAEREAAERALTNRDDVLPELRRALKSNDAEIVRRATRILSGLNKRSLPRYLEYGRKGRVDVLVEWIATVGTEIDEEAYWQGVMDIAIGIRRRSGLKGPDKSGRPLPPTFRGFLVQLGELRSSQSDYRAKPEDIAGREGIPGGWIGFVSRGHASVNATKLPMDNCMLTTAGTVKLAGASESIVFANGDSSMNLIMGSVVVCDGDANCKVAWNSIVIARQAIVVPRYSDEHVRSSKLYAAQSVRSESADDKEMRAKQPAKGLIPGTEIMEGRPVMLGMRFFEIADVGLEASATKVGVRVDKIAPRSPLAKAGLQAGDLVLSVDGAKCPDVDTLRRQLRRAFVHDEARTSVRRGEKTIELTVSFFGYDLPNVK